MILIYIIYIISFTISFATLKVSLQYKFPNITYIKLLSKTLCTNLFV
ncbi:protein of unknown function [Clostridium beijerinckii]|nr:protein of unknown function [Clostridium beijerinckii]